MSFGENLQQQKSHQALLHLQDAEVQLLESIKKCIDHRIKSDKQYANALTVIVNQAQKLDTSVSNPLFQVWNSIIRETEKWIDVLRQNTEKLSIKALERLIHLINEKKIARKAYLEEKLRIDGELNKLKDEVTKLKQEYEKNVIKQIQDRVRLEDLIAKGVPSKKIDDARLKLSKSAQKLHRTHNDYVTALLEATEHEKHYQNTILPNLLNYQEEIQKLTFSKCKSIIKNYAELTDFTKPDYTAIYRNIHYQVDTLSPAKEYEVFVRENKSERLTTVGLEFDGHLLTGYTGTLKENQLAVDTLTIEYVRQNYSKITDQLIECQQKITNTESKLTDKEDQLSKTPSNDQETNKYEVNKQAVLAIEKELSELRCKECILKELQKLYNQQLNKFRNRDPPVAVDLLENVPYQLTNSEGADSPVTTSPDGSRSIQSKLNMVLHKLKKPTQVPPQLPEKDFMAEPAGGNESSLNPSGPALTNNLMPQSVGIMKSTPIPTLDSYQQVTVGQETSGLHQMTSYSSKNVDDEEWFHGVLPREEVQRLLVNDGDYLVRVSKNRKTGEAQYVLSVKWGDHKHFIIQEQDGTWRLETYQFQTIQDLIINQHTSGLPVTRKSGAILKNPVRRENWELKNDDISLGQKIGNGNFGDVFKGTYKPLNLEVAIKTCRETLSEDAKKKFLQEGRILKQYEHPNIVKFIGIAAQRHPVMIVMEYVAGGSLLNFLKKQGSVQSKKQLVKMCQDACAGMAYLENRNCIHRDLAARNCLVGKNNIVKISDFGMSREEEEYTVSGGLKQIPIKWTAPEALNYGVYTSACDVWSFGVLMWEVFSFGMSPYPGLTNSQAKEKVDDGYRMPRPDSMPEAVYSLTLKCWQKEPKDRPTFDTVNTELQRIHKSLR